MYENEIDCFTLINTFDKNTNNNLNIYQCQINYIYFCSFCLLWKRIIPILHKLYFTINLYLFGVHMCVLFHIGADFLLICGKTNLADEPLNTHPTSEKHQDTSGKRTGCLWQDHGCNCD